MNVKGAGPISLLQAQNVVALTYLNDPKRACSVGQHMRLQKQTQVAKFAKELIGLPTEDATNKAKNLVSKFLAHSGQDVSKRLSVEIFRLINRQQ